MKTLFAILLSVAMTTASAWNGYSYEISSPNSSTSTTFGNVGGDSFYSNTYRSSDRNSSQTYGNVGGRSFNCNTYGNSTFCNQGNESRSRIPDHTHVTL